MTLLRLRSAAAAAVLVAGCGGDVGDATRGGGSGNDNGNLRFANVSQVDFVDLLEAGTAVQTNVAAYEATGYVNLSVGTHAFAVRRNGTTTTLASPSVVVARDDHQTLVAYTTGTTTTTFNTIPVAENEVAPASGSAKLRVLNTTDSAVDVYVAATTCDANKTATTDPVAPVLTGLQVGYATVTAMTSSTHVCVTTSGTRTDTLLDVGVVFASQRVFTLVVARTASGAVKSLLLEQPN